MKPSKEHDSVALTCDLLEHGLMRGDVGTAVMVHGEGVVFESEMKKAGRPCKLVGYEGAEHTFFRRAEYCDKTLAEGEAFLVDLGWIQK